MTHHALIREAREAMRVADKLAAIPPFTLITRLADALESLSSSLEAVSKDTERLTWLEKSFLGHAMALQDNGDVNLRKTIDDLMADESGDEPSDPLPSLLSQDSKPQL